MVQTFSDSRNAPHWFKLSINLLLRLRQQNHRRWRTSSPRVPL